ncbi:MAG: putative glycolipid-binding domain-containing protein [Chitinophagaceae bacterium]|nr:putative glycolipid-binding domain-containing protein [Chitinophagaceae bacterium]
MQTNILWTGLEYYSLENCLVEVFSEGVEITSTIIGKYEEKIYKVDYRIKANKQWETTLLEIDSRHDDHMQSIRLESDGNGNWTGKDGKINQFKGCFEVDVSLTPFTNTLPINRLHLALHQSQEIQVIYCDLLNGQTRCVTQKYTRLSDTKYHYENVPNDFEATIQVDENGYVVDYPSLFERTAALSTNYRLHRT